MKTTCSECSFEFSLTIEEKSLGDFIEIGFECPLCHRWGHGYYTNEKLEKHRKTLKKFANKARRSRKAWAVYQTKKTEFGVKHINLQIEAGKYLAENY